MKMLRASLAAALLLLALVAPASAQLTLNNLSGFGGGSPTFVKLAASSHSETATTVTISGIDFGNGGHVALAAAWANAAGNARTLSSVVINGVAATIHVQSTASGVATNAFIASASGVPGGSGSVTITFSASETWNLIYGVYKTPGTLGATDSTDATATSFSDTVNVSAGGVVISAYMNSLNSSSSDFSAGVDTDARGTIFPTNRPGVVGAREYAVAATPATVSSSAVSSSIHRSVTVSFNLP